MKSFFGLLLAALLLAGTGSASAQYPDKAVTCIVPFAPGGAADVSVRMVADYLSKELGQPLVIVNKGGGSGIPGLNFGLMDIPSLAELSAMRWWPPIFSRLLPTIWMTSFL